MDVILPDFTWIRDRLDKVDAIVLTHGHEDHIGGVPYLLRERRRHSRRRLAAHARLPRREAQGARITPVTIKVGEDDRATFGPFDCEFIAVNHSIPDGLAVAIRTAAGLVLHTGDFKMDQFPLDGRMTDLVLRAARRRAWTSFSPTRRTRRSPASRCPRASSPPRSSTVFRTTPGRVIVSSFASHVHRIQQVLDAARDHGRKVAFVGRSMVRNMGIAADLGYLESRRAWSSTSSSWRAAGRPRSR